MNGWVEYALAWLCFLGAHVAPMAPGPRAWLMARLGKAIYLTLFSLLSIALLVWLVRAAGAAPHVPLWDSGAWTRWLVNLVMPVAILTGALAVGMSGLVAAFAMWAAAHLVANGDLAHVVLFGGMALFAGMGLIRSGWPRQFRASLPRLALAAALWVALMLLHPVVVGLSPWPAG
ncbi:NnrU family protein [Paracoccus sp. EGI L200073]|nr:NnrU family protein [Paracoccus salsus]